MGKRSLVALIGVVFLNVAAFAESSIPVTLITAKRTPYIIEPQQSTGLTYDLASVLNTIQSKYQFQVLVRPTGRLIYGVEDCVTCLIIWDNPAWGWQDVTTSLPLIEASDIFIARTELVKNTPFLFDDLAQRSLALVRGYHYQFYTGPAPGQQVVELGDDSMTIKMVLLKRADIGVTSDISLRWFLTQHPEYQGQLIVADEPDSTHQRYLLFPASSQLVPEEINDLLRQLRKLGVLSQLYQKYGLVLPEWSE